MLLRKNQPAAQAMLAGDAARPQAFELVLERLGLSQTGEWIALNVVEKLYDLAVYLRVLARPEKGILVRLGQTGDPSHRSLGST